MNREKFLIDFVTWLRDSKDVYLCDHFPENESSIDEAQLVKEFITQKKPTIGEFQKIIEEISFDPTHDDSHHMLHGIGYVGRTVHELVNEIYCGCFKGDMEERNRRIQNYIKLLLLYITKLCIVSNWNMENLEREIIEDIVKNKKITFKGEVNG